MENMDTSYEGNHDNNIKMLKNKMTLDFNSPASHNKKAKLNKTCILESPDLKMLKLGSPELERMIRQNGLVTATPTPSSALPYLLKQEHELFQATEEQEQFSRGFVDALNQLHETNSHQEKHLAHCHNSANNRNKNKRHSNNNQNSINTSSDSSSDLTIADIKTHNKSNNRTNSYHILLPSTIATGVAMQTSTSSVTTAKSTLAQVPSGQVLSTASSAPTAKDTEHYVSVSNCHTNGSHVLIKQSVNNHTSVLPPYSLNNNNCEPISIKVEKTQQKVNFSASNELSPPAHTSLAQPIDMEDQERIKLERKRLRNRIAASKCRRSKLDRIANLGDKVNGLKGENSELSIVVSKLRDQICSLKQQVMEHVKCGCQLKSTQ